MVEFENVDVIIDDGEISISDPDNGETLAVYEAGDRVDVLPQYEPRPINITME